jgi:hypothetical protein
MNTQKSEPAKRTLPKADRKQLLVYLRPETILQLKSEALHANRYAYEIVQELLDDHFSRQDAKGKAADGS